MPGSRKVLVTGGLGYIGSVLVPYLEHAGYDCLVWDSGFFRDCVLYPPEPATIKMSDARDITLDDLKGVWAVVHLAGISNDPFGYLDAEQVYDPTRWYAFDIAKLCKTTGARFIYASSCSVYGAGSGDLITEDGVTNPQTPYSLNKLQVEGDVSELCTDGFSPIFLRFATLYGLSPRMRFDLVVNMLTAMAVATGEIVLNSDGQAWRPHIHINDVAKAVAAAVNIDAKLEKPLVLNVGDTRDNYKIKDVAEMVQGQVPGSQVSFLDDSSAEEPSGQGDLVRDKKIQDGVDSRTYRVSFERIKEAIPGFKCDWDLERGISSLVEGFRKINLTAEHLQNTFFYRQQTMERLLKSGILDQDLYWKQPAEPSQQQSGSNKH